MIHITGCWILHFFTVRKNCWCYAQHSKINHIVEIGELSSTRSGKKSVQLEDEVPKRKEDNWNLVSSLREEKIYNNAFNTLAEGGLRVAEMQ